jgi:hypothetical protein
LTVRCSHHHLHSRLCRPCRKWQECNRVSSAIRQRSLSETSVRPAPPLPDSEQCRFHPCQRAPSSFRRELLPSPRTLNSGNAVCRNRIIPSMSRTMRFASSSRTAIAFLTQRAEFDYP